MLNKVFDGHRILLLAMVVLCCAGACTRTPTEQKLPEWLCGTFCSGDGKLELQFTLIKDPKLWYTYEGKFEELEWVQRDDQYRVLRKSRESVEQIGYVTKGESEFTINWFPSNEPNKHVVLRSKTRLPRVEPHDPKAQ